MSDEAIRELKGEMEHRFVDVKGDFAELKGEFTVLRGEFTDLRGEFADLRGEMNARFTKVDEEFVNVRREIRESAEESKRHMGVLFEDMRSEFRIIAESVANVNDFVMRVHGDHEGRIGDLETRVTRVEIRGEG